MEHSQDDKKVLTKDQNNDKISFVDARKCRNWQTSKTKDLVHNACVWVQVPSSALEKKEPRHMPRFFFCKGGGVPWTQGPRSPRPCGLRRSVRWEKGPLDLFLFPPHPIFRTKGNEFLDPGSMVSSPLRASSVGSVGKRSTGPFSFSTSPHLPHEGQLSSLNPGSMVSSPLRASSVAPTRNAGELSSPAFFSSFVLFFILPEVSKYRDTLRKPKEEAAP